MESYPTLKITSEENIERLKPIFEAMSNYNLDEVRKHLGALDERLIARFDNIVDAHDDYIESIDNIEVSGNTITVEYTCGSGGLDFLAHLIDLFGPHANTIAGTFDHDEDHDEGEVYLLSYKEGKVFLNNEEYDYYD